MVNIKLDFQRNIILSIQAGRYSVMEAISKRIMEMWNSRGSERLLMLFSVSGSKSYTGLAEMSGPWDPTASINGWEERPENKTNGKHCMGYVTLAKTFHPSLIMCEQLFQSDLDLRQEHLVSPLQSYPSAKQR